MARVALVLSIALFATAGAEMTPRTSVPLGSGRAAGTATVRAAKSGPCTDTLGIKMTVTRDSGAVAVGDEDLASAARLLVAAQGYAARIETGAMTAPTRMEASLRLKAGYATINVMVRRPGVPAMSGGFSEGAIPANAGPAMIGAMFGAAIQTAMRNVGWGNCGLAGPVFGEMNTPAAVEAARRHAATLAAEPFGVYSGLWLVQDSTGQYVSSGVLENFPSMVSSSNYRTIVPGVAATGQEAVHFGFARTPVVDNHGPFRVVYVTVATKP